MKRFYFFLFSIMLAFSAFAEDAPGGVTVKNSGMWYSAQGMSPNGRYICGSSLYNGAYRWDSETGDLMWVSATKTTSEMAFYDVSDEGLLVGQDNEQFPAYYENGEWHQLSTHSGVAQGVTGDGSVIVGDEYYPASAGKPYDVRPTVWYRQANGTYKKEALPNPQTDWLGGPTQFNTARAISNDGRFVVGVQIEDRGRYYSCIVWEKDDNGKWTSSMPFADKEFNVKEFIDIQAKEPQLKDYIFVSPGTPGYNMQVQNFQREHAKWQYELNTKGRTGYFFAVPPVIMSNDGHTLALPRQKTTWTYTEGDLDIGKSSVVHPVTYDLKTKEFVEHLDAEGTIPYGVSEEGTMLSSDGYDVFIIPYNSSKRMLLQDWLMENYNFDLWSALPPNTGYVEDQGISADGKKIYVMYTSVTLEGKLDNTEIVCIKLPDATDGIVKVERNPANDDAWYDLQGKRVSPEANPSSPRIYIKNGKKVMK